MALLKIEKEPHHINVKIKNQESLSAEIALVSVGRKLNTEAIGLEKAGVLLHENGLVKVNEKMETNVPGIYAVGDIASKWWLAHVATHQGLVAADNLTGKKAHMSYKAIPSVVFTHPEVASVGYTLKNALKQGYSASIAAFPFQALGKSKASFHEEGFAQIVLDTRTKQVLGAQVIGHEASTLIAEIGIAITNELTLECITETIHAHPTLSEAWLEAASIGEGFPIHYPPIHYPRLIKK